MTVAVTRASYPIALDQILPPKKSNARRGNQNAALASVWLLVRQCDCDWHERELHDCTQSTFASQNNAIIAMKSVSVATIIKGLALHQSKICCLQEGSKTAIQNTALASVWLLIFGPSQENNSAKPAIHTMCHYKTLSRKEHLLRCDTKEFWITLLYQDLTPKEVPIVSSSLPWLRCVCPVHGCMGCDLSLDDRI